MILNISEAIRAGYAARAEQLIENEEVSIRQGDGRTLACQKIALPNGLSASVSWDRCMDITRLGFRGVPLAYLGRTDEREDLSAPFSGRFSGGMFYTCGLVNVGPGDDMQPTHGRIHLQAAARRSVIQTDTAIVLRGEMRESSLFGENLLLCREMIFPLDRAEVQICDTITNQTPQPQPYMLLYHINLGYPFFSEALRLQLPPNTATYAAGEYTPRDPAEFTRFGGPLPTAQEKDYNHRLPDTDGICRLNAENPALGIGCSLSYGAASLPLLQQWVCLRSGDYVLGLEPTNNRVNGHKQAAAEGSLPVLPPFGTITTELALSLYSL
ncbi:MAG TPA: aldose 1-epimerase family protein [Candidatus Limiplasma sp.]|nr:aldose 1-epimerase family protein [Candidatus Limiplasma sp.]